MYIVENVNFVRRHYNGSHGNDKISYCDNHSVSSIAVIKAFLWHAGPSRDMNNFTYLRLV
jgi:hypothetical protein